MTSATQQLTVELHERSYPIDIGAELLHRTPLFPALPKQLLLVTNAPINALYGEIVRRALAAHHVITYCIGDSEHAKGIDTYAAVLDTLIQHSFNRDCAIIALGGGVVGDLAGFVAATYQRGVAFYQIPTTLLAQVDSSVGGKTAINHSGGKNLIGAFHQPQAVLIDTTCLASLPLRDYVCGLAEMVKYGIIADGDFFTWLEQHSAALMARDPHALQTAIYRSCAIKAEIVAKDEREQSVRALLNLGHTFGHAIETEFTSTWKHGEAVAAGIMIAATLMVQQGRLQLTDQQRIERLLEQFQLPTRAPMMSFDRWQTLLQRDKKVQAGTVRLVVPTAIGQAQVEPWSDWQAIQQAIVSMSSATAKTR